MLNHRLLILLIALALCAFGQPSITPSQLNIGVQAGSSTVVKDSALLFVSGPLGPNADYDLSIRYGGLPDNWLSVSPVHGTTPATLTISANPTNLPAGTYSAQIVATVGSLRLSAVASISLIVAPAGFNVGGVAVNPSSLFFSGDSVSNPQTITVSNAPGVTGSVAFSAAANPSGWLTITQADRATPGAVTVQPSLGGLSAGPHTGTITITALATGKSTIVPVTAVVPVGGAGQTITLVPAQRNLTFNYKLGSASNPTQTVSVSTDSMQYTTYTATASDSWIRVAAVFGPDSSHSVATSAPGLLYVSIDPTGLTTSPPVGSVTLTAPGRDPIQLPVTVNISDKTVFNADPSYISLDSNSLLSSNLALTSSDSIRFNATVAPNSAWLSVTPNSGVSSANATNLAVAADVINLPSGTYHSTITFTSPDGSPTLTVPVELKVSGAGVSNTLQVIPNALDFVGLAGDPVAPKYVSIGSTAGINEAITLAVVADGGWLRVDPTSATGPIYAKVSVSTAVAPATYTGSILITSVASGEQQTVNVTYKLTAKAITATPTALTFTQQDVGSALAPQEVQVTANAPSSFRVASQPAWITVTPAGTLTTPAKLVVSANPGTMAPGSYDGSVLLSGPNDVAVHVTLTIPAPSPPKVAPSSVAFTYDLGSPPPPSQTVTITSDSGVLPFTVVTSTESGIRWLDATPTAGSTPGTVTLSINVAQLIPGRQNGNVAVTLGNSSASVFNVPVTLMVTGSTIQIREVLNAATFAPTILAPGEIVTLTGTGLGPVVPIVARPSAAGAFDTVLGGIQVLIDGIRAPLLMVQNEQINAIAPYALQGRTSAKVQVQSDSGYSVPIELKVDNAAPGVFTSGTNGRGQAAALNADSTPNSVINAAQRGGVVTIYLTGEGQTDPPGQDGRVISTDIRTPLLPVTALIGGVPADVLYAGSGPALVSGMCQVNLRVPDTVAPGTQSLEIDVGGIPSQRGVTIQVR